MARSKLFVAPIRLAIVVILCTLPACQSWQVAPGLSGLSRSQADRAIVRQAKQDPFPSPSDVGMSVAE